MTLVPLGLGLSPKGLKGQFHFKSYSGLPHVLENCLKNKISLFFIQKNKKKEVPCFLEGLNKTPKGDFILSLKGLNSRTEIEEILPFELKLERKLFPPLPDDECYLVDLVGLDVFDSSSKEKIGRIISFEDHGAGILAEIEKQSEEKILLPFINDYFPVIQKNNLGIVEYVEVAIPSFID